MQIRHSSHLILGDKNLSAEIKYLIRIGMCWSANLPFNTEFDNIGSVGVMQAPITNEAPFHLSNILQLKRRLQAKDMLPTS